jgi:hypothetical protein
MLNFLSITNEKQVLKKRTIIPPFHITNSFGSHKPYCKSNQTQKEILKDLMLYINKGCHPLSSIENS